MSTDLYRKVEKMANKKGYRFEQVLNTTEFVVSSELWEFKGTFFYVKKNRKYIKSMQDLQLMKILAVFENE